VGYIFSLCLSDEIAVFLILVCIFLFFVY